MTEPSIPPSLILSQRLADGRVVEILLQPGARVRAADEAAYAVIDLEDAEAPAGLAARRRDEDLVVEVEGAEVLVLEGFFAATDVAFHPTTNVAGGAGLFSGTPLTPDSPVQTVSAAGEPLWRAAEVERPESESGGSPMLLGGLAVGGLGLALAAAGGGGGGGGSNPAPTPTPTPTPPPEPSTVTGTVVGGPVIAGNGLTVEVFGADGSTALGSAKVAADGTFTIDVGDYTGVVIARVVDADAGADYLDEATTADRDLDAALGAVAAVSESGSTVVMNINPLTTLAAALAAREAAGAAPTVAEVAAANAAVAGLFGLSDLHAVGVVPINGGAYDAADGLSAGERYGAILAAFSGADLDNGGDSQQTLDTVLAGLSVGSDGTAVLEASVQALLVQGAQTAEAATGVALGAVVAGLLDSEPPQITSGASAPAIGENTGAGQVVYTATATDASPVTFSLAAGDDAAAFDIDAVTGAVTLTENPDFETQASYTFTVVATDAAGNRSEQTVGLPIEDRDDSAPRITSGFMAPAIDENSGDDQVVYTATADDEGLVTFSLEASGDAAAFDIDDATGAVTLTEDPDFETQASYTFTVVATDDEGNFASQPVTLDINNLDEVAPTITSGGSAGAIDENSGAGQLVYTVAADDSGDVSGGVTYSLVPGGNAAAFTINAGTGAVTLTANPNHESQASYTFTVRATDTAGNFDQQAVTLTINDLDEVAPNITSGGAADIDENVGVNQVVYTVVADDTGDISGGVTYSLAQVDDFAAFTINPNNGVVRLIADPDEESQASYSFTVVATDAAGNFDQQAVTLTINDLDESPPTITSSGSAGDIDENSGANQIVYDTEATDDGDISGGVTYSLAQVNDFAAFTINPNNGVVRLIADPDFETQSSYSFTVVATDAAGNFDQQLVTLTVNDLDETGPSVSSVALTSASGAQNNTLNAGDTVTVTVTMSEVTVVNTSGGTPRVALNVGGSQVFADYVSGSGSFNLLFNYTVQPGDSDGNGISIPSNALQANGGSLADAAGNPASLNHSSVPNNPAFIVDTAVPTLSGSTPADDSSDVAVDSSIVLTFSENVFAGSGDITISDGAGDTRNIAINSGQVNISGNQVTVDPGADLAFGRSYNVQIDSGALTDAAGNDYPGIGNPTTLNFDTAPDPSIVVFDLVSGVSSDHSGRSFDAGTSYTIYIRVDSTSSALSTDGNGPGPADSWDTWSGAGNLGSDDRIVLVGTGSAVQGSLGNVTGFGATANSATWSTAFGPAAILGRNGGFDRITAATDGVDLWGGNWGANPDSGLALNQVYLTAMPANVLTSQGLA